MKTIEERFWEKVDKNGPVSQQVGTPCWIWTGPVFKGGYGRFCVRKIAGKRATTGAHRFSWQLENGPLHCKDQIDHLCFRAGCVNPGHLRPVTHKQNMEHRRGAHSNSLTGIRGVTLLPGNRWQARIRHNGRFISLGCFGSAEEAEQAYLAGQKKYFTHS